MTDTPMLTAEAAALGIDVSRLAQIVVRKAAVEGKALAEIEVKRQRAQAAIRAATNPAEIEAALAAVIADQPQTKGQ